MKRFSAPLLISACALIYTTGSISLAADVESAAEKQKRLIAILKSDAPPQDKAIPCKQLAIYGDKEAVPALAPLLADKDLASWARVALQANPAPEADEALRAALPKLKGNLLIGTMNTIGIRRDAKAIDELAKHLSDPDPAVAGAAAAALGSIGGTDAARAISGALASGKKETVQAVSEGAILCAERFLTAEKFTDATQLYDAVRAADVSAQRKLEAMRGAILARQAEGIPMLLEQLRSPEKPVYGMALRTARELPGPAATDALAAEMERANADRQVMLLLAISDRHDDAVLAKMLLAAEKGWKATRVASLGLLDRFNDLTAVPVLLNGAIDDDADVARAAKATLTRMEGKAVDNALLGRMSEATGKTRQAIIELASLRRIDAALPTVVSSTADSDPAVRRAAFAALSTLGAEQEAGALVSALSKTQDQKDRDAIEKALMGISGRTGTKSLPQVLPLLKNDDADVRIIGLHVAATVGGTEALGAVAAAVDDRDDAVQDEAVGTLATWPNNWPDDNAVAEPLLKLAKSGKKTSYQVQGVRGYLLHLQEDKKLNNGDKLNGIEGLLPYLKQPQQKRLAITTLSGIPTSKALDSLVTLAGDPAVSEEACLAIVNITTGKNQGGISKQASRKALQTVVEKARSDTTKAKAADRLKVLQ